MLHNKLSSNYVIVVALILLAASTIYTYHNRYYLRFIPLPLSSTDILIKGNWLLPSSQMAAPLGELDFGSYDIKTEEGLRRTLNLIQEMSPVENVSGLPDYTNITFATWVKEITSKPFFCTDATQLLILAAWQQGLQAREWHLVPPGWPSGQGHSVVEFYNPVVEQWQLVDAQHAAIIRGPDGKITNMVNVLKANSENRNADINFDYGPYQDTMLNGGRGSSSETLFFKTGLLQTPILQLRQATWLASVPRAFGFSGHFVIGYPIVVDGWSHDNRVWISKTTAGLMLIFGMIALIAIYFRFQKPHTP